MKKWFTRNQAISKLEASQDTEDFRDFNSFTNEELADELCMSGVIHDEDMGGVE